MSHACKKRNNGLTLVELLVAIAILTIITALLIPRLRIINKDRNIREAARVVGSVFSRARDQAVGNRAYAGVILERNTNFVARTNNGTGNRVFYAGTRLSLMEEIVPPFIGDNLTDFAMTVSTGNTLTCYINLPLEHDPANGVFAVRAGDEITFQESGVTYRVTSVLAPTTLTFLDSMPGDGLPEDLCGIMVNNMPEMLPMLPFQIEFDNDLNRGNNLNTAEPDFVTGQAAPRISTPNTGTNDRFDVPNVQCEPFLFRQLRRVASSSVDLPPGYVIDLRYSGPFDVEDADNENETLTFFGLAIDNAADANNRANKELQFLFDENGNLDQVGLNGQAFLAGQSMNFYINEIDPNEIVDNTVAQADLLLNKAASLWVTVGLQGGTNIAYNIPPGNITSVAEVGSAISASQSFARQGFSASQ